MLKALALVWLFSGLRNDEIKRLRLGCIRWERNSPTDVEKIDPKICLLDVPVNKTNVAFTKPVDAVLGMAVDAWEKCDHLSLVLSIRRPANWCNYSLLIEVIDLATDLLIIR